jgi:Flp pilus assembly protein TadD
MRFSPLRVAFVVVVALSPLGLAACAGIPWIGGDKTAGPSEVGSEGQNLRLARAARGAGDFASAVNLYRTVLAVHPNDPGVLVELGNTFLEVGAVDDAIDTFRKVKAKTPARLDAELGLAHAQLALHKPDAALGYIDSAAKISPNDPRVLVGRGVALDLLNRHAEAQANYRAVLEANPEHVAARNDLALSLALAGDFPQAVDIMMRLTRSTAATPRIRQNLALIYGLQGNMQQAAAVSRVDLDEKDTEANLRLFGMLQSAD